MGSHGEEKGGGDREKVSPWPSREDAKRPVTNERPCLSLGGRLSGCKDGKQIVCLQSTVNSEEDSRTRRGEGREGA